MKLAVSTLPCKEWSLEKTLRICRDNGIQGLELRLGLNSWSDINMTKDQCDRITEQITVNDMEITDLGTSVVISGYREEALEEIKTCMVLAGRLQTKGLRIMLGHFRELWSQKIPEPDYTGICKWMERADQAAGDAGTEIWIETHNEFAAGSTLKRLFTDCSLKNTRLIWDVLHPLEQGESIMDSYYNMKEYLAHVHIKDGRPWENPDRADWKYTEIGKGIVPVREIMKMLTQDGYDGYYSLEWESLWREEIKGPDYEGEKIIPQFSEYMKGGDAE